MRFSFPIPTPTGGEYTSADALFNLLEKETTGNYLLGKSNFWHGGVHFTDKSAPHCKDKHMVRCMGDGEVVAYRLLSDYKTTPWAGNALKYSSGFCLVRHHYPSPENTSDGPKNGQKNELTFFSLYMHLAPVNAYKGASSSSYRIKVKVSDLQVRERAEVGVGGIGKIQRGSELEIQTLEEITSGGSSYLFASAKLCSGAIHYNDAGRPSAVGDTVTLAVRQKKADSTITWFADFVQDGAQTTPAYWQGKKRALVHNAVNLRDGDTTPGAVVATLPVNSEVEYDPAAAAKHTLQGSTQQWLMARCKLIRNAGNSDMPAEFWMCVAPDFVATRNIATPQLDTVVTCNQRIKAGDPIGFMGLHETAKKDGGKYTKHQVHVEIFSTDTRIKDFLRNKAEVAQGTQYLKIAKGTQLHTKSTATPPTFTASDQSLKNDCIVPASDCKKHKDAADKEWYEIKAKDGAATVSGCIAASDAGTLTQHDWEKLGFKIVEAPVDFDGHLDTMASQPFFKKLCQSITGVDAPPDRDKVREVLTGQEYQSQWSKIVAYHPSEWKADSSSPLWSVLNVLLHKAKDRHAHEQARIDSCIWWDEVAGKVPELGASGMAWHWHPVGMVSHLSAAAVGKITVQMLRKVFEGTSAEQEDFLSDIAAVLNENASTYRVDSALRLSHFFAQVREEVGPACRLVESFNYNVDTLKQKFRYFRTNPQEAEMYGRKSGQSANQVEIANRAYNGVTGNRGLGNGNVASGDGWRYKGRGLVQLTGRANYDDFSRRHKEVWNESVDFLEAPELLETARYAVRSAVGFWLREKLYEIADAGSSSVQVNAITEVINRYTNSYPNRVSNFNRIYHAQKIFSEVD